MKVSRPPFYRFQMIMASLKARDVVTIAALAEELEVCEKTVQRDVEFMRDRLRLPIETAPGEGYYLAGKVTVCECCAGRLE